MDFVSFLGPVCPICGQTECYRPMKPYWRYAIDLDPSFRKEKVPIARFECSTERSTFSLLPVQLIPYHQYTLNAVIGTLLLGAKSREAGQLGFYGASVEVDPDSGVTPWLVACWLVVVARGLDRAHAELCRHYDLAGVRSLRGVRAPWGEVAAYLRVLIGVGGSGWPDRILSVTGGYSRETQLFLFGNASQHRRQGCA